MSATTEPFGFVFGAVAAAVVGSLFAAAEAALSSLNEGRLQALAIGQTGDARAFARYLEDRLRVLSRWLVGRISATALAAVLATQAAVGFGLVSLSPLVPVLAAVVWYGTFAEVLSTLARRMPEQAGALALRFLRPFEWVMIPLAEPLTRLGLLISRRLPPEPPLDARIAETEVEWVVSQGEATGAIQKEPAELIRNVLDLKDLTARDLMVPRRLMSTLELATPLATTLELVSKEGHSRYPVYCETLDHIVGLFYAKDLFAVVRDDRLSTASLDDVARKTVLFVAEAQSAWSVLREMRARQLHMAIVIDEFGGTSGLVTLEDIIEEIVGEIRDEYDTDVGAAIELTADGRVVADATISLTELSELLGHVLPVEGNFESLGGLLIHEAGRVPAIGATVRVDGLTFIVRDADEKRVKKVEIVNEQLPESRAASVEG